MPASTMPRASGAGSGGRGSSLCASSSSGSSAEPPPAESGEAAGTAAGRQAVEAQRCSQRSRRAATNEPEAPRTGPSSKLASSTSSVCRCAGAGAAAGAEAQCCTPERAEPALATTSPEGAVVPAAGGSGTEARPRLAMRRSASCAMHSALWPREVMRMRCGDKVTSSSGLNWTSSKSIAMTKRKNWTQVRVAARQQPLGSGPFGYRVSFTSSSSNPERTAQD